MEELIYAKIQEYDLNLKDFEISYSNREYDAISKRWIGQHKPGLTNSFGKSFRNQAKATNRGVYYKFDSQPAQSVIEKLNEYSLRYNVKLKINY